MVIIIVNVTAMPYAPASADEPPEQRGEATPDGASETEGDPEPEQHTAGDQADTEESDAFENRLSHGGKTRSKRR